MTFERRDLGGGLVALASGGLEDAGFVAAFLERTGGVSPSPFDSLNGSFQVGDEPGRVRENRRRVAAALGVDRFCVPGLVHGTSVTRVGAARALDGFSRPARLLATADGTTTGRPGVGLGAFSADCVIAILADPGEGRVTMVHAGWRGLASGVVARGVAVFRRPREVRAAVGPSIGPCHYEVGREVLDAFAAGSGAGAVSTRRDGRWYLDLAATFARALRTAGVRHVEDAGVCTACEPERFFSYRRDRTTGRHLALGLRLAA